MAEDEDLIRKAEQFRAVRQALGYLGLALPVLLIGYSWLAGTRPETSVSAYYYTPMGDVFVGALWAIGVFLVAYRGYKRTEIERMSGRLIDKLSDVWVSRTAGIAAIGVAIFPTSAPAPSDPCGPGAPCPVTGLAFDTTLLHYLSAALFFVCIALFCLILFPRGDGTESNITVAHGRRHTRIAWTPRNRYFVTCGIVILAALLGIVIYGLARWLGLTAITASFDGWNGFFWLEVVAILAFSAAWLEKGRAPISPPNMLRQVFSR